MYIIGLTGGIATGKSNVSHTLKECGAELWDADQAARDVVLPGKPANTALRQIFDPKYFNEDGSLKRRLLANDVFSDVNQLRKLNATVHPAIILDLREHMQDWKKREIKIGVVDAALLFETGIFEFCDEIWVTSCAPDEQIDRLMARDGLTYEQAVERIEMQMTDFDRRKRANRIIDTSESKESTQKFVRILYEEILDELET